MNIIFQSAPLYGLSCWMFHEQIKRMVFQMFLDQVNEVKPLDSAFQVFCTFTDFSFSSYLRKNVKIVIVDLLILLSILSVYALCIRSSIIGYTNIKNCNFCFKWLKLFMLTKFAFSIISFLLRSSLLHFLYSSSVSDPVQIIGGLFLCLCFRTPS